MADSTEDYLAGIVGSPVKITSNLRSPQRNAQVGGSPTSAHLTGQAYDFVPQGISTKDAADRLARSGIPFDQIEDGGDHVHISFAPTNRKQVISSKMANSGPDAFDAAFGNAAPAASGAKADKPYYPAGDSRNGPAAVTVGGAGAGSSGGGGDAFDAAFGGGSGSAASGGKPQQAAAPGMLQSASAGVVQGARDVMSSIDPLAQWVDKKIGPITLGGLLPTAEQAHANNLAARGQFDQQYGDNTTAQVGRVGGEIAASLPALAAGGEILGPLAAGVSRAAPAVAPGVNFLMGATKGNKLLQLASRGASGALQGASAAGLTSGASDQPIPDQLRQGAEFGGVLNTALPAAKMAGGKLFDLLHDAGPSARTALASKAVNEYGIPLRGSQISSTPFARYADSAIGKLPFTGMEAQNEAQRTAFTRAVAGTMGTEADNLTPEVMSATRKRIGQVFNDVAARTSIQDTSSLLKNLNNVVAEASQAIPGDSVKPLINQVENIKSLTQDLPKGVISKDEMIKRGADGSLSRAYERYIPVGKVSGLEPTPAASDGNPYVKGKPIIQPIEVAYDKLNDTYTLYGGNHRITQATLNGDKFIKAFVEPDGSSIGSAATAKNPEGLSGASYQALTRKGAPLDRAMSSSDPNIRHYAGQIKDALDDALEGSASGADLKALKTARLQWKNMRTVQDLASKAGIEGEITPSLLLGAVKKSYKDMPYSGAGEIGDLAHIGQQFLKEPPSSGTAERMLLYRLLEGGAGAYAFTHPTEGMGAAALLGTGKLAAMGLKSKAYRNAVLGAAKNGDNTLNTVLGNRGRFVIPSTVIGGNRLLNPPDEASSR